MRHVEQAWRRNGRDHLSAGVVDVLLAIDGNLRALVGKAQRAPAVDRQHVVLAGFDVPHADHGDQPVALLVGEVVRLGEILLQVVELPAFGVEFGELVVIEGRAERQA